MADEPVATITKITGEALLDKIERFDRIAVDRLHANPWNPNRMDDRTRQATRESIATHGFIDPVTVRADPKLEGHFQIIDGEHRWQVATEDLGYQGELPCAVLYPMSDGEAKKLTVILNDTRGEHDDVLLGNLLADIAQTDENLTNGLRYSDDQMKHLLGLASDDWGDYDPPDPEEMAGRVKGRAHFLVTASCPRAFEQDWRDAMLEVQQHFELDYDPESQRANGQALTALVAYFRGHTGPS